MKAINHGQGCYVCNLKYGGSNPSDVHTHEVFYGTGYRQLSKKYGMMIELCGKHHNLDHKNGVHFDRKLDFELKQIAQAIFEKQYLRSDFIKTFGMSYLDITFDEYVKGKSYETSTKPM